MSHSAISFRDGEIQLTLDAHTVWHVDAAETPWSERWKEALAGVGKSKVDWAWQREKRLFLLELKDPESQKAIEHPLKKEDETHVKNTLHKLTTDEFARNFNDSIARFNPFEAEDLVFVVLIAVSDKSFDSGMMLTAAENIKRRISTPNVEVVVANLEAIAANLFPGIQVKRQAT